MPNSADLPWAEASATGVGSHPGDEPLAALRTVFDEVPGLPYLPELPARGPGSDIVGRTAGLLVDLPVWLQPTGWRLTEQPGRDLRRARDAMARDLDALQEVAGDYTGPLKVQLAGVWTLASRIELPRGEPVLADEGAVADLAASLCEGAAAHVAEVRKRVPGGRLLVQLDEPALPRVLAGGVPTASGLGRLRPVERTTAVAVVARLLDAVDAFPVIHCCATNVPYALLREAGARAVSIDMRSLRHGDEDALGELIERDVALFLGIGHAEPSVEPGDAAASNPSVVDASVNAIVELWRRLGFEARALARLVVVTPPCGLAGFSAQRARDALTGSAAVARALAERAAG